MDHLPFSYITLYPLIFWLASLVVGGGLGWLAALLLRLIFKAWPVGRNVLMLLPWRAVIFALLWMLWSPLFYYAFHIRDLPAATYDFFQIGASLVLLTFILTIAVLVRHWFPSTLGVRLVSEARTLLVVAIMVATIGIGTNPSVNFIRVIRMYIASHFDKSLVWQGWLAVFLMMSLFDFLPGVIEMGLALAADRKKSAAPA